MKTYTRTDAEGRTWQSTSRLPLVLQVMCEPGPIKGLLVGLPFCLAFWFTVIRLVMR